MKGVAEEVAQEKTRLEGQGTQASGRMRADDLGEERQRRMPSFISMRVVSPCTYTPALGVRIGSVPRHELAPSTGLRQREWLRVRRRGCRDRKRDLCARKNRAFVGH